MGWNRALFLAGLLWAFPAGARASDGADFLKIPVTARALNMGGIASLAKGADALFSNPAGIANASELGLSLTDAELYQNSRLDAAGFVIPRAGAQDRFGASVLSFTQPALEARDASGAVTGSFYAVDLAAGLSWARPVYDGKAGSLSAGLTGKYISQTIANVHAGAPALDAGLQASRLFGSADLRLGASVQNLGPPLKFEQEFIPLPTILSVEAGYAWKNWLAFQVGVNDRPHASVMNAGGGVEAALTRAFQLRAGYSYGIQGPSTIGGTAASALSNWVFGLGWRGSHFGLDYAFASGGSDLGNTQRVTLNISFYVPAQTRQEAAPSERPAPRERVIGDGGVIVY